MTRRHVAGSAAVPCVSRALAAAVAGLLATVAALPLARAAGIEYPDNGTLAIGRGGAHAANPDDGLAFQYNPAGLAQQRGLNLLLDARMSQQDVKYSPAPFCAGTGADKKCTQGAPIENAAGPFAGPSFALGYGFGAVGPLSELTAAIGVTGPSSIGIVEYPKKGAQRYSLTETDYFIGFLSGAVGVGIGDWLRLGVTGQLVQGKAKFSQAVWSGFGKTADINNTDFDATATFEGESSFQPTGVVGVTVLPRKDLAIGLSYRPQIVFDAPGELTTVPPDFAKAQGIAVENQMENGARKYEKNARLELTFADILRLGAQFRPSSRWQVELGGTWERWSKLQTIVVRTQGLDVTYMVGNEKKRAPITDIVFQKGQQDAYSVRLGGDFAVAPGRLTARAGYTMETSAIPANYASVDFPNWGRHALAVGASLELFGAFLDVAYAHHFVATQVATDSQVLQQVSPELPGTGLPKSEASFVGNGTYEAGMDIVSLSLRVPFAGLRDKF